MGKFCNQCGCCRSCRDGCCCVQIIDTSQGANSPHEIPVDQD